MRIRIEETIDYFNGLHPEGKLTQRQLARIVMPDTNIIPAQLYLKKLNSGELGSKKSINADVIERIIKYTGVTLDFLFDFEHTGQEEI